MTEIRNNWTKQEITDIYNTPILDLVYRAASVHRKYHDPNKMHINTLAIISRKEI